jgi:hypothetical protein
MKRMILALILTSLLPSPMLNGSVFSPPGPFIYGTHLAEHGLFDLAAFNVPTASALFSAIIDLDPTAIKITPDNNYAYIAFGGSATYFPTIQVLNTFTETFSSFTLGTRNLLMVITPDGKYGYTTTSNTTLNAFEIPSNVTHPNIINLPNILNSTGIAVTADQHYLYVTDSSSNNVQIVDISNPLSPMIATPVGSFTVGTPYSRLSGIALTSDGSTAYVLSSNDNEVYQVTSLPASPTAGISISLNGYPGVSGPATAIVLSNDNQTAYVGIAGPNITHPGALVIITDLTTIPVTTFYPSPDFFTVVDLQISKDGKYVAAAGTGIGIIKTIDNSFTIAEGDVYTAAAITSNPNPPIDVQGCAMPLLNDYTIVLTWDPPAYDPSPVPAPFQYNIYSDPALTTLIGIVPATDPLTFSISSLDPTQTYTFYIATVDQLGDQSTSVSVTVAPYETCYPEVFPPSSATGCFIPMGSTVTNVISWTPPASGPAPTLYQIFYDAYLMEFVNTVPGDVFSYEDVGVSPSINTYYIISVDAYGDISEPIEVTITDTCYPTVFPPDSIEGCFIDMGSTVTNLIVWTPPSSGPTPVAYELFYDPGLTDPVNTVSGTTFSYQDPGLDPTQTYSYYIVSIDAYGDFSAPIGTTITDVCYPSVFPPDSIEGCFVSMGSTVTNFLQWTAPSSGPTPIEYKLYYDANLTQLVATVPGTTFSYQDPNLSPNQTYTYYIISIDTFGHSSAAISVTVTQSCYSSPYTQPDPPTNVIGRLRCNIFLDRNESILCISWTASDSSNVVSYNIYNGSTLVGNILATRPLCFITALGRCDNGKNFSITAVDNNGNESVHAPVTIM